MLQLEDLRAYGWSETKIRCFCEDVGISFPQPSQHPRFVPDTPHDMMEWEVKALEAALGGPDPEVPEDHSEDHAEAASSSSLPTR